LQHVKLPCKNRSVLTRERAQTVASFMGCGRIFYVGEKWGQSRGLGGQRKIDTVEH